MRALFLLVIIPAALISLSCSRAAAPVSISNQPVSVNGVRQRGVPPKPLPMMSWISQEGQKEKIGDYKGKVLILDFWATYCPPCKEEIPHLNELQAKHGTANLQVIGLHVGGEEDRPKIPDFTAETNIEYPIAFPESALVSYVFEDTDAIPQTAVFDRHGQLVTKIAGFNEQIKRQLDAAVEIALRR